MAFQRYPSTDLFLVDVLIGISMATEPLAMGLVPYHFSEADTAQPIAICASDLLEDHFITVLE